jgi:hypothetical protein
MPQRASQARLVLPLEMTITTVSENKSYGGVQGTYSHDSAETRCAMRFGVFLPPQARTARVPALYWLSGLTCTEENFIVKAGAQRVAAELGLAIVVPDTSPRGLKLPGEAASYDFGLGAGFYVDATEEPWAGGYRMYSYVTRELPKAVYENFPVDPSRAGISAIPWVDMARSPSRSGIPMLTGLYRLLPRYVRRCVPRGAKKPSLDIWEATAHDGAPTIRRHS